MRSWRIQIASKLATAVVMLAVPIAPSSCAKYGTVVIGHEGDRLLGKPAPDFTLVPLGGGPPVRLSAQRGKTVMLVFWYQGGHALPLVDQAYRFFKPKGLVVWTINYDDEDATTIGERVKSRRYMFPVLLDRGGAVSRQYIESGNTTAVIVNRSGIVVRYKQNFFGDDDFWSMLSDSGFRLPSLNKRSSVGRGTHRPIRTQTNSLRMRLAYVPAGSFLMGQATKGMPEWPMHRVEVSGFWIGQYEVTNAQFDRFEKRQPGSWGDEQPAVRISWDDAVKFCKWLSRREGRQYRLPTEAEWEYAARGGLIHKDYPWGDEPPYGRAVVGKLTTSPVGSHAPNEFGLYDMAGNIAEWVSDWYDQDYYRHSPAKDPSGPVNPAVKLKIRRGGAFDGWQCYCWLRVPSPPELRMDNTGVRVVLDPRHGAPDKPKRIAQ